MPIVQTVTNVPPPVGGMPSPGVETIVGTSLPKMPAMPSSSNPAPLRRDIASIPAVASMKAGVRVDDALSKPGKYEVTEESDFTIELHLKKYKGRWILMTGSDGTTDDHSVTFRMWTFNEMVEMKKLATSYDLKKKIHEVDNDLLNRLKIQRLLKSWTFGRDNKHFEIHHVGGNLTDESWVAFTKLQPNIAQYIIDEMNQVYEYNR